MADGAHCLTPCAPSRDPSCETPAPSQAAAAAPSCETLAPRFPLECQRRHAWTDSAAVKICESITQTDFYYSSWKRLRHSSVIRHSSVTHNIALPVRVERCVRSPSLPAPQLARRADSRARCGHLIKFGLHEAWRWCGREHPLEPTHQPEPSNLYSSGSGTLGPRVGGFLEDVA